MLKLITWNIQSARSPDGGADIDGVLACLERIGGRIDGPLDDALDGILDTELDTALDAALDIDVLCLQEVACGFPAADGSNIGDQFAELARRLPGWEAVRAYAVDTLAPDGGRRRMGSMVFSRHPIVQVLRHSLPWPADPEVPSIPRVALEVTLDTPLGLLRVLNVHLEYFSEVQRLAQVEALRALQHEACAHARRPRQGGSADSPFLALPRPASALLLGDFNMLPGSHCHEALLAPFDDDTPPWRDAWLLAHPGRAHAPTVGLHDPSGQRFTFDYAFVGADLAARVRALRAGAGARGSDHQPLLLELG
jgi:endonuclease/exonuclease/phosphatase family metal-dependent hydrolase